MGVSTCSKPRYSCFIDCFENLTRRFPLCIKSHFELAQWERAKINQKNTSNNKKKTGIPSKKVKTCKSTSCDGTIKTKWKEGMRVYCRVKENTEHKDNLDWKEGSIIHVFSGSTDGLSDEEMNITVELGNETKRHIVIQKKDFKD